MAPSLVVRPTYQDQLGLVRPHQVVALPDLAEEPVTCYLSLVAIAVQGLLNVYHASSWTYLLSLLLPVHSGF